MCPTRRNSICLNIPQLRRGISLLRPQVIFPPTLEERCNYRCSVVCRRVYLGFHACMHTIEQTGGGGGGYRAPVLISPLPHDEVSCPADRVEMGLLCDPLTFSPRSKIRSSLLHFIWSVGFKQMSEMSYFIFQSLECQAPFQCSTRFLFFLGFQHKS